MMDMTVRLTIDGKMIEAEEGATLLAVAQLYAITVT
jgi:NADH dehydrogenase/NADH:ubiquinone oxidoreductase subunit G